MLSLKACNDDCHLNNTSVNTFRVEYSCGAVHLYGPVFSQYYKPVHGQTSE